MLVYFSLLFEEFCVVLDRFVKWWLKLRWELLKLLFLTLTRRPCFVSAKLPTKPLRLWSKVPRRGSSTWAIQPRCNWLCVDHKVSIAAWTAKMQTKLTSGPNLFHLYRSRPSRPGSEILLIPLPLLIFHVWLFSGSWSGFWALPEVYRIVSSWWLREHRVLSVAWLWLHYYDFSNNAVGISSLHLVASCCVKNVLQSCHPFLRNVRLPFK